MGNSLTEISYEDFVAKTDMLSKSIKEKKAEAFTYLGYWIHNKKTWEMIMLEAFDLTFWDLVLIRLDEIDRRLAELEKGKKEGFFDVVIAVASTSFVGFITGTAGKIISGKVYAFLEKNNLAREASAALKETIEKKTSLQKLATTFQKIGTWTEKASGSLMTGRILNQDFGKEMGKDLGKTILSEVADRVDKAFSSSPQLGQLNIPSAGNTALVQHKVTALHQQMKTYFQLPVHQLGKTLLEINPSTDIKENFLYSGLILDQETLKNSNSKRIDELERLELTLMILTDTRNFYHSMYNPETEISLEGGNNSEFVAIQNIYRRLFYGFILALLLKGHTIKRKYLFASTRGSGLRILPADSPHYDGSVVNEIKTPTYLQTLSALGIEYLKEIKNRIFFLDNITDLDIVHEASGEPIKYQNNEYYRNKFMTAKGKTIDEVFGNVSDKYLPWHINLVLVQYANRMARVSADMVPVKAQYKDYF